MEGVNRKTINGLLIKQLKKLHDLCWKSSLNRWSIISNLLHSKMCKISQVICSNAWLIQSSSQLKPGNLIIKFKCFSKMPNHIQFWATITSCDTTLAFSGGVKQQLLKCLRNKIYLVVLKKVIYLDKFRYVCFVMNIKNKMGVQLACLLSASSSAHQYIFLIYYEEQGWLAIN